MSEGGSHFGHSLVASCNVNQSMQRQKDQSTFGRKASFTDPCWLVSQTAAEVSAMLISLQTLEKMLLSANDLSILDRQMVTVEKHSGH